MLKLQSRSAWQKRQESTVPTTEQLTWKMHAGMNLTDLMISAYLRGSEASAQFHYGPEPLLRLCSNRGHLQFTGATGRHFHPVCHAIRLPGRNRGPCP